MAKYPGLVRRSGSQNWYYKVRVPTDLVALYDGKTQIWRSLGTADRSEAERVWYGVSAAIRDEFDNKLETLWQPARGGVRRMSRAEQIRKARRDALEAGETQKELTHVAANELARTWFVESVNIRSLADPPDRDEAIADLDEERSRLLDPSHPDTLISTQQAAEVLLERFKFAGVSGEPSYEHLTGALRMAMLEMNRIALERLSSGPGDAIRAALFAVPTDVRMLSGGVGAISTDVSKLSIKEAADRYWEDELPNRSNTDRAEITKVRSWLNLIVEFFGASEPISVIDASTCTMFLRLLKTLPANRSKKYVGLTLQQTADAAKEDGSKLMAYRTSQSYKRELAKLIKWCRAHRLLSENPLEFLSKLPRVQGDETARMLFRMDQLHRMFSAPLYTGCKDDERGYKTPGDQHPRRGRFWLPLLGLFTGARQGELCQLRVKDIETTETGTPFIRFWKEESWMSGKTKNAIRSTPIHPELVAIGFLKFVEQRRSKNETFLFPEMLIKGRPPSARFTKLFRTFRKSLGIPQPGPDFHSFRHTTREALKRIDILSSRGGDLDNEIDIMFGWAIGKEMRNRYARGAWPVDELAKLMKQVRYPELDLSHLHPTDG